MEPGKFYFINTLQCCINVSTQFLFSAHKVVETVRDLLAIDTKMAKVPDENGNLPLTISILNEQDYITTKLIFDASPEIGQNLSANDGLIPFMSAAVGDWDDEIDQINTVFFLLQADPSTIKSFIGKNK